MRSIEDFRGTYKKEKIWLLGSGSSLGDYPKNFFDNKIHISINWIFRAFPPSEDGYILTTHMEPPKYLMEKRPELLKKCILGLPMATKRERWDADSLGEYKDDPIYFRWHWIQGNEKLFLQYLKPTVESIMKGEPCKYICLKTNMHYAIQMAVILGAKKINLAGCEAKMIKGKGHVARGALSTAYKEKKRDLFFSKWRLGTKLLTEAFRSHGIEIKEYYYETNRFTR